MGLFPKSENFFACFEQSATNALAGADKFMELMNRYSDAKNIAMQIKDLEHASDKVTHETLSKLNQVFITPIDREDIHSLITKLDDILDLIDAAASRLVLYEIKSPPADLSKQIGTMRKAVASVLSAVIKLKNFKKSEGVRNDLIEIKRLEDESDNIHRAAMANLFRNEKNAIDVIKLKEIYEDVENAVDRCDDVANVIEAIVLKNS